MLDAMELEQAKRWPKLGKLNEKIDLDTIFPQNVLNFAEYQNKLQRLALLAEVGDTKGMQALLDNQDLIEKKNQMLQPIFRDIKSLIRHMTHTPEYELMQDYIYKRDQILNSPEGKLNQAQTEAKVEQLRELYGALLAKRRREMSESLSV